MREEEIQETASSLTMLRQMVAFAVDMLLMMLPMFLYPSVWMLMWVMVAWLLYIPIAEYYYGQTLGMRLVGTRIYGVDGGKVPWSAVSRRHQARFSMFWGVVGWLTLVLGMRIAEGYIILHKDETAQRERRYVL